MLLLMIISYFSIQVSPADKGLHCVEQTTLVGPGSVKMPLEEKRLQSGVSTEKFTTNVVTYKSSTSPAEIYQPLCDIDYRSGTEYPDIVPRRAYYDNRTLSGKARDTVVVFTIILDTIDASSLVS